jgi:hypothetical protein
VSASLESAGNAAVIRGDGTRNDGLVSLIGPLSSFTHRRFGRIALGAARGHVCLRHRTWRFKRGPHRLMSGLGEMVRIDADGAVEIAVLANKPSRIFPKLGVANVNLRRGGAGYFVYLISAIPLHHDFITSLDIG